MILFKEYNKKKSTRGMLSVFSNNPEKQSKNKKNKKEFDFYGELTQEYLWYATRYNMFALRWWFRSHKQCLFWSFEYIINRWPDGINNCVCVTRYAEERQIEGHIELLPTKTFGESGFPLRKNKSSYLTFNRMFCFVT